MYNIKEINRILAENDDEFKVAESIIEKNYFI